MSNSAALKPCASCGQECAGKPRMKDARGRYLCQACAKKRQAAMARSTPPAAPRAGVDPVLAQLIDEAPTSRPCPACARSIRTDSALCTHCGYNIETGKTVRTRTQAAPKEKGAATAGAGFSLGARPTLVTFLLGLVGTIFLAGGAFYSIESVVPMMIIVGLWGGISVISMIYAAYQDGDSVWGTIGTLQIIPILGAFCGIAFALYYCTVGSGRTAWKVNYWMANLASFCVGIAFAISIVTNPDLDDAGPESFTTRGVAEWIDEQQTLNEPEPERIYVSQTAIDSAEEGEDPAAVELALMWIAERRIRQSAYMLVDGIEQRAAEAEELLADMRTIEDFPEDVVRYSTVRFRRMRRTEREALLRYVTTGDWDEYTDEDEFYSDIDQSQDDPTPPDEPEVSETGP